MGKTLNPQTQNPEPWNSNSNSKNGTSPHPGVATDAPEVSDDGWNAAPDRYTLLYRSDAPPPAPASGTPQQPQRAHAPLVLLKALVMGPGTLLVTLAGDDGVSEPAVQELRTAQYYDESKGTAAAQRYSNLDELVTRVTSALTSLNVPPGNGGSSGTAAAAAGGAAQQQQKRKQEEGEGERGEGEGRGVEGRQQQPGRVRVPDDDPLRIGPPMRPGTRPMFVGESF